MIKKILLLIALLLVIAYLVTAVTVFNNRSLYSEYLPLHTSYGNFNKW